ncbi:putative Ig domain-containing protein [Pedobacter sp. KR3-3]|uniref:Ig domain-containing protein n=1 Tax=Pedobacter albus TaxID=3113905 RepID=A0ABU7I2V7_9SPHI|nr:putative Ig domain-containing protein [Pedobacter sp. KR3-3]MEE1943797.1 putative Ig domain-containing protein [Pedobacter sp. KR3-3]
MKSISTFNLRSIRWIAFLLQITIITLLFSKSYAQTRIYATTATVKSAQVDDATNATNGSNTFATVKSYGGAALGLGKYSGELELQFASTIPANTTTFLRIDGDASLLNVLLGGNLGSALASVVGNVALGDHYFEVGARNSSGNTVVSGISSSGFGNADLRLIKDANGFFYLAITPSQAYDRVYLKDRTDALLLSSPYSTKVYYAFYTSGTTGCASAFATSYEGSGLTVDLLGLGKAGVTNPQFAIDADQTNFSEISLGALGVAGSISQTVYFAIPSQAGDEFNIRMRVNPALLSAGLLNNTQVTAYNGNTQVYTTNLNNLLSLDLLGLLNAGQVTNIPFSPGLAFDRVKITLNSLLNVGLTQTINLYGITSTAPRPTFTAPQSNAVNACYNSTAVLGATTGATNELRWYDVADGGSALATSATFTTPALTANTTYYVAARRIGCTDESVRVPIVVTVNPQITFATTTLANGTIGSAYSKQITAATGGTPAFTYALAAGSNLPAGLVLSASGQIGGTPTAAGTFNFNITATDSKGCTATAAYTLKITPTLVLPGASLPNGTVGTLYPTQVIPLATGGSTPYTYVATNLPPGLSFNPATREITGTPTQSGTFVVGVNVTDADGNTTTTNYTVVVKDPLVLATTTLSDGTVGTSYPTQILLPATGGTTPYTYSVSNLPPGLNFNPTTREITGTPTTAGTYTLTLNASDADGKTATANYTIKVVDPLVLPAKTLADGNVGVAYPTETIPAATGGTGPYTYVASNLPPGLSFNPATRQITGTPTQSGNYSIGVTVTDGTGKTATNTYPVKVIGALSLPTATLANGTVGVPYPTQTLPAVSGGTAPYTYVATNLPPGLSFNTTTREITGTPTQGGTYTLSLTATDANGNKVNTDYTITVGVNQPVVASATICSGSATSLSVSNLQAGVTYNWYGPTGNTPLATNNAGVFNTGTLTSTTTFYVEAVSGTAVSARTAVAVTINPAPAAPVVTTNNQVVNSGQSTVLQATANSGDVIKWYNVAAGGTALGTGPSFTTPALTTTTTFYAETSNSTGCVSASRTPVVVTVLNGPVNPNCNAATNQNSGIIGVCVLCSISGPGNSTDADLTNYTRITLAVGVGATGYQRLIFPNVGLATDSIRLDLATPTGLLDLSVLSGITINVMNGSNVVTSYQLNSALIDLKLLAGNRFKATFAAGQSYDRVEVRFGATVAALSSLDIYGAEIIYPKPTVAASGLNICAGSTTTLNATPNGGTTLTWYDAAVGGSVVGNGNSFTTPALATTTTYYIEVSKAGCANAERVPVTVNVVPVLAVPTVATVPASCEGSTTVLAVTNPDPTLTYNWYETAAGGTPVFSGANFTTPALTATKTYYVEAALSGCVSATRGAVTVTVNPRPVAPQVQVSSSTISPGQTAILTASSSEANVIFNWYSSATATAPVYTGATFVTPPLTATTSYFVESTNTLTGCSSASRIQVTVTVDGNGSSNPVPCEGAISQINGVTGVALLAGVSNPSLAIDNDTQTGSTLLMPVGALGASVYQRLAFGSVSNIGDTVRVLINSPGKLLSASVLGTVQVSTLNGGVSNNDVLPSNSPLISLELLSGNTQALLTFVPAAQFDAVEVRLNSGVLGALTSLNVNYAQRVIAAPEVMAANVTACLTQTAVLTVKNPKAGLTYKWYDVAGVYQTGKDGVSFTTPALTADTRYFVAASSASGCVSYKTAVNVTTTPAPAVPELLASNVNTCAGNNVLLQIKNPIAGITYKWYDAGGTYQVGKDGVTFTAIAVVANTSYSVEAVNACGLASATRATATITVGSVDLPIVTPAAVTVAQNSPAILTASSSTAGATFRWYDLPVGGTLLASTATYVTPPLAGTTTFYVEATVPGPCPASGRASVVVTVIPNGTEPTPCGAATVQLADGVTGVALLAGVSNPGLAVDNNIQTGSSLLMPVGALGASVYQRVGFAGGLSKVGDTLKVVLTSPGKLLSLAVLPTLTVTTYNGATSNNDEMVVNNPLIHLELLSDNSAIILTYVPTAAFDGVEVRLNSGLIGALTSINFNYAQRINVAPQVAVATASACQGSAATLNVKNPQVGVTYRWYLETVYQADGTTFNTPTSLVAGTYNYYVKAFVNGCESAPTKVVVTILPPPAPPTPIAGNPTTTCINSPVTLGVQAVAGVTFNWYDASGNLLVLNNSNYTTPANLAAGTYDFFVEAVNSNSCANASRTKITITVKPSATAADVQVSGVNNICSAGTTTLTASSTTVTNPVFIWYSDAALTNVVSTQATFTTPALSATTTYYVTVSGTNKCANAPADAKTVTITINPSATAADINLAGVSTICAGSTVSLTASSTTVTNPVFTWYKNATLTDVAYVGANFVSPPLNGNTTYYVTVKGDNKCENKPADAQVITITVNPLATAADILVSGPTKVCSGSPTTLNASSTTVTNPVFTWYSDAALTNVAHVGADFTTPPLSNTTTYYVVIKGDNKCTNGVADAKAVTITVNPYATAADINLSNMTICAGNSVSLMASSFTVTNPVFTWYSDASLTSVVFVGPTYLIPSLSSTTTFYVTVKGDNKCENKAVDAKVVTVTVNPLSGMTDIILTGNTTVCNGSAAVIAATSPTVTNPVFTWYADAALTNLIYIGPSFTSQPLSATTTFYVTVKGDNSCANSPGSAKAITITVKPVADASDITANNATICQNGTATLVASTTTVTNPVFTWYNDAALTSVAFVGASYTTGALAATKTYYVTVKGDNKCENSSSTAKMVTVTVNTAATAADINLNPATVNICGTGTATITASSLTVTNPVFTWYTDASLTNVAQIGAVFVTPTLSATTTYYVTVKGSNKCENTPANAKTITITVRPNATPADISVTGTTTICENNTTTLTASSATVTNPVFTWYSDAALTNVVSNQASFTTTALTANTTYYVTVKGDNKCENVAGNGKVVAITVNPRPVNPIVSNTGTSICAGDGTTLTVQNADPTATYQWFDAAVGGTMVGTGATFNISILNTTTDYYVQAVSANGCGNASGRVKVTVTVTPRPTTPVVATNNVNVCIGNSTVLSVSNPQSGVTYTWYNAAVGGTAVGSGASFTTPAIATNITYYVEASTGSCISPARAPAAIIAMPVPVAPVGVSANNNPICSGSTAVLSVNNPDANLVYRWYANSSGGAMLAEGNSFTTPALNATTTYYVESVSKAGGCASNSRTAITVNVLPVLAIPVVRVESTTANSITFAWNAVAGATAYEVSLNNGNTWVSPTGGPTGTTYQALGLQPGQSVTIVVRAKGQIDCQTSANSAPVTGTASNPFANELYIPNTFTPNGDGKNDIFYAYGNLVSKFNMKIYNQWGQFLFESNSLTTGWDGRFNGTMQPNGVYVYTIAVTFADGTTKTYKGTITLLR